MNMRAHSCAAYDILAMPIDLVLVMRGTRGVVASRQWPEESVFVARFCTLRESQNLWPCTKRVRFSHGHRFCESRNVQKGVTQIIYLGPLPSGISLW